MGFTSPTGLGLKLIFCVAGSAAQHEKNFLGVQKHVRERYGLEVDTAARNLERLCFLSFDPLAIDFRAAIALKPLPEEERPRRKSRPRPAPKDGHKPPAADARGKDGPPQTTPDRLRSLLSYIHPHDRSSWLATVAAVKLWGRESAQEEMAFEIVRDWAGGCKKYSADGLQEAWDSLNRGAGETWSHWARSTSGPGQTAGAARTKEPLARTWNRWRRWTTSPGIASASSGRKNLACASAPWTRRVTRSASRRAQTRQSRPACLRRWSPGPRR